MRLPLRRARSGGIAAAVLVSLVLALLPPSASMAADQSGVLGERSTRTYSAIPGSVANPERGFYRYTGTHYRADQSGHAPLDGEQLRRWRTEQDVTLVYRIFYLERFATRDAIDPAYLDLVAADLATARRAGVKLVVRFAYSETSSQDAPAARVAGHIRQLAPVLNANADVVFTIQAGFVGQWGEWYYTDNFASDPARPWVLSDGDWSARGQVLSTLLAETAPEIFVQVRYPAIKQRLVPAGHPHASRVGVHNDCFVASATDHGTFVLDGDRQWLAEQARTVPVGGETCEVAPPRSLWPSASADLVTHQWTYLNADFHRDVLDSWGEGLAEAGSRLGYRLRLVDATFPTRVTAGGRLSMTLRVANDGYAAPLRARPVNLVLRDASTTEVVPLDIDLRSLRPGVVTDIPLEVTAPARTGPWALHLAMPDPAARLADDPAYAVRLANAGLWDPVRGTNDLQATVEVVTPTAPTSTPTSTPTTPAAPVPTADPVTWRLGALAPVFHTNGWGPAERDMSNGEEAAGDGGVITIGGTTAADGFGVHAPSSATLGPAPVAGMLHATIGVDDEVGARGSVRFEVLVGGAVRYRSPVLTGTDGPLDIAVPIEAGAVVGLVVSDGGDGNAYDHADWAAARIVASGTGTAPAPTATATPTASPTATASPTPTATVTATPTATATPTVTATVTAPVRLSSLTPRSATNGWGPIERDRSNGEAAAGDGGPLRLRGKTYAHGLGVHAASSVTYTVPVGRSTFHASVGVDDEVQGRGSVIFEVWVDGTRRYRSARLTGKSPAVALSVPVAGARTLTLVVADAGDGKTADHADWAAAELR